MKAKREQILTDRRSQTHQIERRLPDDFEDLTEEEQQRSSPNSKTSCVLHPETPGELP